MKREETPPLVLFTPLFCLEALAGPSLRDSALAPPWRGCGGRGLAFSASNLPATCWVPRLLLQHIVVGTGPVRSPSPHVCLPGCPASSHLCLGSRSWPSSLPSESLRPETPAPPPDPVSGRLLLLLTSAAGARASSSSGTCLLSSSAGPPALVFLLYYRTVINILVALVSGVQSSHPAAPYASPRASREVSLLPLPLWAPLPSLETTPWLSI